MKLHKLRTLKGQLLATGSLFVFSLPIAIAVILCRGNFEQHMYEKYSANYSQFDNDLKSLIERLETGVSPEDREMLSRLSPQQKVHLYEDWLQRRQPPRPNTPRTLVEADPSFFLARAEQTVVCGGPDQRMLALDFLEKCGSSQVDARLERLARWAEQRKLPEWPEKIQAVRERVSRVENRGLRVEG